MLPDKTKQCSQFKLPAVAHGFFLKPNYAGVIELKDALLHIQYLFIKYRDGFVFTLLIFLSVYYIIHRHMPVN